MLFIKILKGIAMQLKAILLIGLLLLPLISNANESEGETNSDSNLTKLESMDIPSLIEKAKFASSNEKTKIENLIKKRIAKAHRDNYIKKRG